MRKSAILQLILSAAVGTVLMVSAWAQLAHSADQTATNSAANFADSSADQTAAHSADQATQPATHSEAGASAARKIAYMAANGRSVKPSTTPTVLTAAEWNAYLNEGAVKLPEGISNVRISSDAGMAHAAADVDFDRLTANRTRSNPFLALFTGKHHVTGSALVAARNGVGTVHVASVEFDGVEVPPIALEYFSNKFLRPKYGNAVGLDARVPLGNRISSAVVGTDQVTITQR